MVDLMISRRDRDESHAIDHLMEPGDGPRFLPMIGLVAAVVAIVILVFFGIGYAFGRMFL